MLAKKFMLQNRWIVHVWDSTRMTALHWAAKRNHLMLITELINFGNFIDARDCAGRTPLFIAARSNNLEALRLLVLNKADPYIGSITGKLPIHTTTHMAA
jgi:ankyrin repeat protein